MTTSERDSVSSNGLLKRLEEWIESNQKYACVRQYPNPRYAADFNPQCPGCLIEHAALELRKRAAAETRACPFCGCRERHTDPSGSCFRCGAPEDLTNARDHIVLPPWDAVASHLQKRLAVKARAVEYRECCRSGCHIMVPMNKMFCPAHAENGGES